MVCVFKSDSGFWWEDIDVPCMEETRKGFSFCCTAYQPEEGFPPIAYFELSPAPLARYVVEARAGRLARSIEREREMRAAPRQEPY